MASITLTIPDAIAARVIAGFCGMHGYQDQVQNDKGGMADNPETRQDFIKRVLLQSIKKDVLRWEGDQAQRAAHLTCDADIQL